MICPTCSKTGFVTDLPVSILLCKEHGFWSVRPHMQPFVDTVNLDNGFVKESL